MTSGGCEGVLDASDLSIGSVLLGQLDDVRVHLLTFSARIASNCSRIIHHFASVYPARPLYAAESDGGNPFQFTAIKYLGKNGTVAYRLFEGSLDQGCVSSASDAAAHLEYLVVSSALSSLSQHILMHSGSVARGEVGVLIPGASGVGKSTLVTALCLSGFSYLSDEVAVLEQSTLSLLPFTKSICLKEGGWRVLSGSFADRLGMLGEGLSAAGSPHYVMPPGVLHAGASARVGFVLIPDRRRNVEASLYPCSRAYAVAHMARHSLNLVGHGQSGVESLIQLARGANCYVLTYDDLRQAVSLVNGLVDGK